MKPDGEVELSGGPADGLRTSVVGTPDHVLIDYCRPGVTFTGYDVLALRYDRGPDGRYRWAGDRAGGPP